MRFIQQKGYEGTSVRVAVNELNMPIAVIGELEDLTLKLKLFYDDDDVRIWFGKYVVMWFDDIEDGSAYMFDTLEDAILYVEGDD